MMKCSRRQYRTWEQLQKNTILKEEKKGNLIRKKYFSHILQMSQGKYWMDILSEWKAQNRKNSI